MAKTCFLHIGSPKTGSTSIQAACFRNREALERQGVLYPGDHRRHNALLTAVHDKAAGLRFNRLGQDLSEGGAADEVLKAEFAQVAASLADRVLYSNELFLGQASQLDLEGLHRLLGEHYASVRVICYLRDPYKLLVSRAQEQVKSGVNTYEQVVARPPVMDLSPLGDYRRLFGAEAVVLRSFDAVLASGVPLLEDFLRLVLPEVDMTEIVEPPAQNIGLSLEAALIMSGLNVHHGLKSDWSGRHLRPQQLRGIGATRFALPPESVLAVRDRLLEQYAILDALGMHFTPPDWDNLPEAAPDWSSATLEQVALLLNELARPAEKNKGAGRGRKGRRNVKRPGAGNAPTAGKAARKGKAARAAEAAPSAVPDAASRPVKPARAGRSGKKRRQERNLQPSEESIIQSN